MKHSKAIDFSANINFRGMPPSVAEAARAAIGQSENYPDTRCEALKAAIGEREDVSPDQIVCGNGAAELIFSLVLALKPKQALLVVPTFYEYEQALMTINCRREKYGLSEKNGFALGEDFLERITTDIDVVFLCNPNNPTGIVTSVDFLGRILKRCERCNAILVLDECFLDFLDSPKTCTMKPYIYNTEHLVILKAFTKMYAMPGLRLGYGISRNVNLLHKMECVTQPWNVSVVAQQAGIAAALDIRFAEESRNEMGILREKLKQEIIKMGYPVFGSTANYIFFQGSRNLYERCLAKGIIIRDCSNYEGLSAGWYRVAVRGEADNLLLLAALKEE